MGIQLHCLMQLEMTKKVTFLAGTWWIHPTFILFFYLTLILFYIISSAFMWLVANSLLFHPVNNLFLITGGLHLLRGTSLYCCCFTHDSWDCYSRRALLSIREDSLVKFSNLFSLLVFLSARSSVECICVTDFTFRGLSDVTQQVPWLHMLYAAIGAIVYTLVSLHSLNSWKARELGITSLFCLCC